MWWENLLKIQRYKIFSSGLFFISAPCMGRSNAMYTVYRLYDMAVLSVCLSHSSPLYYLEPASDMTKFDNSQ